MGQRSRRFGHPPLLGTVAGLLVMLACMTARGAPPGRLERVRAAGVLRCGAAIRPGLAYPGEDHAWHGVLVELCRAVAVATIGAEGRIAFTGYAHRDEFARARETEDLAFLTGSEVFTQSLAGQVQPGPAVVFVQTGVMVAAEGPVQRLADLAGTTVCAEPGTGAERALVAEMRARNEDVRLSGWQELEEMMDAFTAGRCPAMAGEVTALAALRVGTAAAGRDGRILEEPLAVAPVLAVTGQADGAWSSTVAWVLEGVVSGGTAPAEGLGLAPGWRQRVDGAVGSYDTIVLRSLGEESALRLPAGPNRSWRAGGLLAPPAVQ